MCGVTGFIALARRDAMEKIGALMANTISHRGPNDSGVWIDAAAGICLAHRRLSIIDLSPAGHQPMQSASGRFVISFNGEIYNHAEIRTELTAAGVDVAWRGHSDTETLLAAFDRWGVRATLGRAVGMFAIAIWDRDEHLLTLGRDRFGEKPLYYGWLGAGVDRAFVFGSELKALRAHPSFVNPVCRDALALYLQYCVVPAPYSIYQNVFKLLPGCLLTVEADGLVRREARVESYWRLNDAVSQGLADPIRSDAEAVADLDAVLRRAISQQSVADVPVGAFLSGGVDSSTVVALMQAQSNRRVQTFTVGLDEVGLDESRFALQVARHLGTDHQELRVTSADAQSVIPFLPTLYDEPFGDCSQIPTHLICRAARQQVTVALSGDAGDELFGGYDRYAWGQRYWSWFDWMPPTLRRALGAGVHRLPVSSLDLVGRAFLGRRGGARLGDKAHKLAQRLKSVANSNDLYRSLVTAWPEYPPQAGSAGERLPTRSEDPVFVAGVPEIEHRMMIWDALTYLPDDILTKVDRAAMSVSLETRMPFLDHRVFDLAWRMPLHMKIRKGQTKWALRQVLYKYVPPGLIERPKAGFSIPIAQWLRGPLRDWAENLLEEARLTREGYLDPGPIRETWRQHLSNQHDWSLRLWSILMFQTWLAANS
jgi:asparagine synthase (glutamine-hydrolysing)